MQALTSRFTKKRPSGLRPEGRISAVPPSFTSESSKEVTLLCENELMRVIIDHYGEDAAVDRYDDTHFTAKIEVNPSGTFYGWIFKFKGKIKILSPKECITEIQQIAQEFI